MHIQATSSILGAYICEVDLSNLSESEWKEINKAFLEYAVLVFPKANLTDPQQVRFSKRFGKLETLTGNPLIKTLWVSNLDTNGDILPLDDDNFRIIRGNEYWHTDSSYMPVSAKASCLSAVTIPAEGGETSWADMRAAYDALDSATKSQISGLAAYHSFYRSQEELGQEVEIGSRYGFHRSGAPLRPLVKDHSETGRKALYIGRHAYRIPGMEDNAAQELLKELNEFACQPCFVFEHSWSVGDMVLWDNRCVLHRVKPYDYSKPRVMRHTRISGDTSEFAPTDPHEQPTHFAAQSDQSAN
ncbi:MAG: TauD/TfdA family dioxygenase [Gammaproteobacteria bacterium]|nr:TauD/TfdA family dioxygenase [Gammaproteobacteria bacterium]